MRIASLIWNRLRHVNRLPGAYSMFRFVAELIYRDGSTVTIHQGPARGFRWRFYRCHQPWMAFGLYEPEVAQLIFCSLKPGDVFYDVGANAGYFTLIAARAVGPTGRVMAFDPVPMNASTIQEQVDINQLQAVCRVEQVALCDTEGTKTLLIPTRNANAHLADVAAPHVADSSGNLVEVRCTTLDRYVAEHPSPNLVKMDIEGAEVLTLLGAMELLNSQQAPIFLITAQSDALAKQVRAALTQAGYHFGDFQQMIHAIPRRLGELA